MTSDRPRLVTGPQEIPGAKVLDAFEESLRELFSVENPSFSQEEAEGQFGAYRQANKGMDAWVYYPWRNQLVHTLSEESYFFLRTARNRNIITREEQEQYHAMKVGIAGLSVGSSIASALVQSGGPKTIKLADPDVVQVSNLNRVKGSLVDVGENKALVAARLLWEIDPYADLHLWPEGVSEKNLREFLEKEPKVDVFIDEMDSIPMKGFARKVCKELRIPVLMATDNGDGVIVDVERYDTEPEHEPFHGALESELSENLEGLDKEEWARIAGKIIGEEHVTERVKLSVAQLGRTLSGVPQLGTSAALAGSAVSLLLRALANNMPISSGKYILSLESLYESSH